MPQMDSNGSFQEFEWEEAQKIQISEDLILAAQDELRMLALVDGTPALQKAEVLQRAIERYLNCWLPLAHAHMEKGSCLEPPLDCAWIWHCHRLNPVQYGKDCFTLFQKTVDLKPTYLINSAFPQAKLRAEKENDTLELWNETCPHEPYHFVRFGEDGSELQFSRTTFPPSKVKYDLFAAAWRQATFYYQVNRPWMFDGAYLRAAENRYKGFLHLIKRATKAAEHGSPRPFIVPTYDIDLLWHAHQLCPMAYRRDMIKLLGRVLDHDDTDSDRSPGQKLNTSFVDTCELWVKTFGSVYEQAGAMYRGPNPDPAPPAPATEEKLKLKTMPLGSLTKSNSHLTKRETVQVHLVLLGARNIPKKLEESDLYIRVTALNRCPSLRLVTNPVKSSGSQLTWNQGFSFEAEMSTEGVRLELMSHSSQTTEELKPGFHCSAYKRKAVCIGDISLTWSSILDGSTLSSTNWSTVEQKSPKRGLEGSQIHYSLSFTPPSRAPYILRAKQATSTDDTGAAVRASSNSEKGQWLTRTIVDHSGEEKFVVRQKEGQIMIHRDTYSAFNPEKNLVATGQLLAEKADNSREWVFFDGAATFKIKRDKEDGLECSLHGDLGHPVRVLPGKRLQYQGTSAAPGLCFTLVRYTQDSPLGKATALINLTSASYEVMPDENVELVLLLSSALNGCWAETELTARPAAWKKLPSAVQRRRRRRFTCDLGAVLLWRNGLSSKWCNLNYENSDLKSMKLQSPWWEVNPAYRKSDGPVLVGSGESAGCGSGCGGGCQGLNGAESGGCGSGCGGGCGGILQAPASTGVDCGSGCGGAPASTTSNAVGAGCGSGCGGGCGARVKAPASTTDSAGCGSGGGCIGMVKAPFSTTAGAGCGSGCRGGCGGMVQAPPSTATGAGCGSGCGGGCGGAVQSPASATSSSTGAGCGSGCGGGCGGMVQAPTSTTSSAAAAGCGSGCGGGCGGMLQVPPSTATGAGCGSGCGGAVQAPASTTSSSIGAGCGSGCGGGCGGMVQAPPSTATGAGCGSGCGGGCGGAVQAPASTLSSSAGAGCGSGCGGGCGGAVQALASTISSSTGAGCGSGCGGGCGGSLRA